MSRESGSLGGDGKLANRRYEDARGFGRTQASRNSGLTISNQQATVAALDAKSRRCRALNLVYLNHVCDVARWPVSDVLAAYRESR